MQIKILKSIDKLPLVLKVCVESRTGTITLSESKKASKICDWESRDEQN